MRARREIVTTFNLKKCVGGSVVQIVLFFGTLESQFGFIQNSLTLLLRCQSRMELVIRIYLLRVQAFLQMVLINELLVVVIGLLVDNFALLYFTGLKLRFNAARTSILGLINNIAGGMLLFIYLFLFILMF